MIATLDPPGAAPLPFTTGLTPWAQTLPQHISPTAAKSYLSCSLRFWFERVACIRKPTTPALHLGKAVHAALQAFHLARWRGDDDSVEAVADAYERAGGRYYPKLLCAVPFTPVTGRRLLATGPHAQAIRSALASSVVEVGKQSRASSAHFNFLDEQTWAELGASGLLLREDQQFHWINRGYQSFDDFLGALSSRKRKTLRRERRDAQEGLEIIRVTGDDIREHHWDAFFEFYMDTGGRKWGSPYLNREFFGLLHERMADKCLLILALDQGEPIAGALNMIGSDTLYGRYWGRVMDKPFLHFEICYYQAIDHAIRLGLKRVEAGAQGQHKIARGYLPEAVHSAHWIADPALREPVARYLDQERRAVEEDMGYLTAEFSPFKSEG